jgi:hypothetical protein
MKEAEEGQTDNQEVESAAAEVAKNDEKEKEKEAAE